jgi:hypothetical protein
VPQYGDLPLTILRSVSTLSGEDYHDVEDEPLRDELKRRGFQPSNAAFLNVMRQLRDAGYLHCEFLGGMRGVSLVRLEEKGRIEVEGWPATPGSLSSADVAELVASLEARGEDQTVAPEERSKARAAAGAIKDLGLSVTGGLILGWLKHLGCRKGTARMLAGLPFRPAALPGLRVGRRARVCRGLARCRVWRPMGMCRNTCPG